MKPWAFIEAEPMPNGLISIVERYRSKNLPPGESNCTTIDGDNELQNEQYMSLFLWRQ